MTTLQIRTTALEDTVDITAGVVEAVRATGVDEGAVLVYCPHTTAGIYINEGADPDVVTDVEGALGAMVPRDRPYRHAEGNSPAHIRSILTGNAVTVPVSGGRVMLGRWQHVFLAEFDGPRTRDVHVQVLRAWG
jgi:secondary thiamine-phosphate synthase enzyme